MKETVVSVLVDEVFADASVEFVGGNFFGLENSIMHNFEINCGSLPWHCDINTSNMY